MAGYAFVEAVFAEDAEGGGEAAFEVVAFGVFVGEGWGAGRGVLVLVLCVGSARWRGVLMDGRIVMGRVGC